jgi:hypothetical protein
MEKVSECMEEAVAMIDKRALGRRSSGRCLYSPGLWYLVEVLGENLTR